MVSGLTHSSAEKLINIDVNYYKTNKISTRANQCLSKSAVAQAVLRSRLVGRLSRECKLILFTASMMREFIDTHITRKYTYMIISSSETLFSRMAAASFCCEIYLFASEINWTCHRCLHVQINHQQSSH